MKKSDIEVGKEYAIGDDPKGQFPRFNCAKVKIISLSSTGLSRDNRAKANAIICSFVEDAKYFYKDYKAGDEVALESGRNVRMTWEEYTRIKKIRDDRNNAVADERERKKKASEDTFEKLKACGAPESVLDSLHTSNGFQNFIIGVDQMAIVVDMLADSTEGLS